MTTAAAAAAAAEAAPCKPLSRIPIDANVWLDCFLYCENELRRRQRVPTPALRPIGPKQSRAATIFHFFSAENSDGTDQTATAADHSADPTRELRNFQAVLCYLSKELLQNMRYSLYRIMLCKLKRLSLLKMKQLTAAFPYSYFVKTSTASPVDEKRLKFVLNKYLLVDYCLFLPISFGLLSTSSMCTLRMQAVIRKFVERREFIERVALRFQQGRQALEHSPASPDCLQAADAESDAAIKPREFALMGHNLNRMQRAMRRYIEELAELSAVNHDRINSYLFSSRSFSRPCSATGDPVSPSETGDSTQNTESRSSGNSHTSCSDTADGPSTSQ